MYTFYTEVTCTYTFSIRHKWTGVCDSLQLVLILDPFLLGPGYSLIKTSPYSKFRIDLMKGTPRQQYHKQSAQAKASVVASSNIDSICFMCFVGSSAWRNSDYPNS